MAREDVAFAVERPETTPTTAPATLPATEATPLATLPAPLITALVTDLEAEAAREAVDLAAFTAPSAAPLNVDDAVDFADRDFAAADLAAGFVAVGLAVLGTDAAAAADFGALGFDFAAGLAADAPDDELAFVLAADLSAAFAAGADLASFERFASASPAPVLVVTDFFAVVVLALSLIGIPSVGS